MVTVKPLVHQVQSPTAVLIFDDSIEEKPYTDENEISGIGIIVKTVLSKVSIL